MNQDERSASLFGMAVGGLLPIFVAAALVLVRDEVANANVALALVVFVVLAAAIGGRGPGMLAAVVSALSFDFFHTRPYLSLTIDSQDDVETTALLLTVGLIVGTIASRALRARASAEAAGEEIRRIHRLADKVAAGVDATDVITAAQHELTELLTLRSCRFDAPPFADAFPRLARSGVIEGPTVWRIAGDGFELPAEGVELPVLARGQQVGRFVFTPTAGVGVTLEQRVVALALADQVAAALGTPRRPVRSERNPNA